MAERYDDGDRETVWKELASVETDTLDDRVMADVERVAERTMARVAANVATLVVRLTLMGYRFGSCYSANVRRQSIEDLGLRESMAAAGRDTSWIDRGALEESVMGWPGPRDDIDDHVHRAERLVGRLPVSLRALVRKVDTVDLSGSFPSWNPSAFNFDGDRDWPAFGVVSDALSLLPVEAVEEYVNKASGAIHRDFMAGGVFGLTVKADHRLTANFAGSHVTTVVPSRAIDPVLDDVYCRPGVRLTEYLRAVFEWGGFPGFEFAADVPGEIEILRRGLLPI